MPPIAEKGGGGWTCGRHHHRERLRNDRVLRAQQDGRARRGVHHHQLPYVRRRQWQQLAPRATSRWHRGAKQTALAPREGQALEERSGSSRSRGRPRTRGIVHYHHLPGVRQRQQLARRARRAEGASPRRQRSSSRAGARRTCGCCARTSRIGTATYAWRPAAVRHHDDNGGSSRATGAESKRALRACARIRKGLRPCRPRPEGGRAAQHARLQERTPCVTTTTAAYVDVTRRRR